MKINKKELQEALEKVKPGLANKELIEQSTSFAFMNGMVITYNDEISIAHPVKGLDLEGAVLAENLYKFLNKIKQEEIEMEVRENEIVLTSGQAKAGLTLQAEIKLPLDEEISKKGRWKDIPEGFIEAISFVMTSCSKDMSEPKLTCVHVDQGGIIEASDGYRVAKYTLKEEFPVDSFLLPSSSAVEVVRMNPIQITEGRGWIHFKTDEETIISCRIIEEQYVTTDQHLKVKGSTLTFPASINDMLDKAIIFAKREHLLDESITITIGENRFKIYAKADKDAGWFEEEVRMSYKDEKLSFQIVPHLLKEILAKSETCDCIISSNKDRLKFSGEGWEYMTLLRRMKR